MTDFKITAYNSEWVVDSTKDYNDDGNSYADYLPGVSEKITGKALDNGVEVRSKRSIGMLLTDDTTYKWKEHDNKHFLWTIRNLATESDFWVVEIAISEDENANVIDHFLCFSNDNRFDELGPMKDKSTFEDALEYYDKIICITESQGGPGVDPTTLFRPMWVWRIP